MSPMTMVWPSIVEVKAAQEVSPMNGAIRVCSTVIATSSLGLLTLKLFSFSFSTPFRPVMDSIFAVSRPFSAATPIDPEQKSRSVQRPTAPNVIIKGKDRLFILGSLRKTILRLGVHGDYRRFAYEFFSIDLQANVGNMCYI